MTKRVAVFFASGLTLLFFLVSCGGGNDTLDPAPAIGQLSSSVTIKGTLSGPSDSKVLRFATAPMEGMHVNVCYPSPSGKLYPLPGLPTVLSLADGGFEITITPSQVPAGNQLFICAKEPTAGNYHIYADLSSALANLPADNVITIEATASTTVVTCMACSRPVLFSSAGYCLPLAAQNVALVNAVDGFFDRNSNVTPNLENLCNGGSTIPAIAADPEAGASLQAWVAQNSPVAYGDIMGSANSFKTEVAPEIPSPGSSAPSQTAPCQGTISGGWSGNCCIASLGCENVSGGFSVAIGTSGAVSGSYSGSDSGSISGSLNESCGFTGSGSTSVGSWLGNFTGLGSTLSGTGSWSGSKSTGFGTANCSGSWSG